MEVKVGQVWQDFDKRFRNDLFPRLIEIQSIGGEYAYCEAKRNGRILSHPIIRLDRFKPNSTGYILVTE